MEKLVRAVAVAALGLLLTLSAYHNGVLRGTSMGDYHNWGNPEGSKEHFVSDYVNDIDKYVTLGDYKNLTLNVESMEITDEYIIDQIDQMLAQYPDYTESDKEVIEDGDTVNIDYEGTVNGEKFDGGSATGFNLTIGSGQFIEGFEDQLVGSRKGEELDLNLTFPEEYPNNPDLAGKDVVFHVKVNYIANAEYYSYENVTDEFVSNTFGMENKQALYDYVKDYAAQQAASSDESNKKTELTNTLFEICEVNIPEELMEYQLNNYLSSFVETVQGNNLDVEEYLASSYNNTPEEFYENVSEMMEKSIKQQMILSAIAAKENMTLDEEAFGQYVNSFVSYYGYADEKALFKDYPEKELRTAYLCNDVVSYLLENATINNVTNTTKEEE